MPALTARSVVLSVLLGAHPPQLPARELVRIAEKLDIGDATLRVALTRMVAAGDLHRNGSLYRLNDRLVERQRRQDEAIHPRTVAWDGRWEIVAVTGTGRTAAERAALRTRLAALRLAERREGLWLRPANLARAWPDDIGHLVERFTGEPGRDPRELAGVLWDVDGWDDTATTLLHQFHDAGTPAQRFAVAAAIVRLLLTDPVLPPPLLTRHPPPADAVRAAYRQYRDTFLDDIGRAGGR
ncbi:MAG TPA: PaaX domain-containing protein, C- domain protein [Actinoplanes sp.]